MRKIIHALPLSMALFLLLEASSYAYDIAPTWMIRNPRWPTRKRWKTAAADVRMKKAGDAGDSDEGFDIEAARQKLESILKAEDDDDGREFIRVDAELTPSSERSTSFRLIASSLSKLPLPAAPLLTSIERERREAEIKVLQYLQYNNDDALSELWKLWFQERGAESEKLLKQGEEWASHPESWKQAEARYCELISIYGVHWAEPVNKLATLYFLQGKLEESVALCKVVIAVKPWHIGALSGIVAVYVGLQDLDKARLWAAGRLPALAPTGTSNERRELWVNKAIEEAKRSLSAAEWRLKESFGSQDRDIPVDNGNEYCNELDDKDSWQ